MSSHHFVKSEAIVTIAIRTKSVGQIHKYFMIPYASFQPFIVNFLRDAKKEAVAYTINNVQDVQKIYNMGIRVIMTDNVPMVIERLRSKETTAK